MMRTLLAKGTILLVFCAGCLTGLLVSRGSGAAAQSAAPAPAWANYPGGTVPPPQVNGKWMYWAAADLKARAAKAVGSSTLTWSPQYRLTLMKRDYMDPPQMTRVSKTLSHWGDGEMHEDMTQIYFMIDGTGAVALGGDAETKNQNWMGQWNGGPLKGTTLQKVKPGDVVVIPPRTWHQAQPDPGGFTYAMCHVETRNLIP